MLLDLDFEMVISTCFQQKSPIITNCSLWLRHTPNYSVHKAAVEFGQAIIGIDNYHRQKSGKMDPVGCNWQLEQCSHKDIILTWKTVYYDKAHSIKNKKKSITVIIPGALSWEDGTIHKLKILPMYFY